MVCVCGDGMGYSQMDNEFEEIEREIMNLTTMTAQEFVQTVHGMLQLHEDCYIDIGIATDEGVGSVIRIELPNDSEHSSVVAGTIH